MKGKGLLNRLRLIQEETTGRVNGVDVREDKLMTPSRDAVTRSAAQSRPATCTSLGGTCRSNEPASMQFLFHKLLASLKTPEEDHNGHQGFATLAIDRNVLVNLFVYKVTKSNNALLET
ncbi:hypothetical protein F2Q69_00040916 [Brassica cretica]|uniref:Uncharacterized protein n=1 Tax=Brassica cretica TaxID=69181 RepID=A0A8S9NES7_BRACR|nr:hypothetical protein F2Q69_00040916 [Brassica cretica]